MLRKPILGLLLLWCALSFLMEMNDVLEGWDRRAYAARGPQTWRFGNPQLERLATCLADVRERVPPGGVIAFASPEGQEIEERSAFFRARWAAWFLPAHEVLPLDDPSAPTEAEYVVDYRARLSLPRLELIAQLRGCRLFRVRPL